MLEALSLSIVSLRFFWVVVSVHRFSTTPMLCQTNVERKVGSSEEDIGGDLFSERPHNMRIPKRYPSRFDENLRRHMIL